MPIAEYPGVTESIQNNLYTTTKNSDGSISKKTKIVDSKDINMKTQADSIKELVQLLYNNLPKCSGICIAYYRDRDIEPTAEFQKLIAGDCIEQDNQMDISSSKQNSHQQEEVKQESKHSDTFQDYIKSQKEPQKSQSQKEPQKSPQRF
jgi:hypothetical protein